jgi:hypothetical protein
MTSIRVDAESDLGERRSVEFPCSGPSDGSIFECEGSFELAQGSPTATWRLTSVTLFYDDARFNAARWTRYTAADLANPHLFPPVVSDDPHTTFVHSAADG